MRLRSLPLAVLVAPFLALGVFALTSSELTRSVRHDLLGCTASDDEDAPKTNSRHFLHDLEQRRRGGDMRIVLVDDLIDGQTDLQEVADAFAKLNELDPPTLAAVEKCFSGKTDRERAARQVIQYVRSRLAVRPSTQAVMERLEKQFEAMSRQDSIMATPE